MDARVPRMAWPSVPQEIRRPIRLDILDNGPEPGMDHEFIGSSPILSATRLFGKSRALLAAPRWPGPRLAQCVR